MSISRIVWVALGAVVAVVAVAAAPLAVVVVIPAAGLTVALVVVVTAPLAVVVVAGAVVVVVSPSRLLACSLKSRRALLPTLLSLPQAASARSATTAISPITTLPGTALLVIRCSPNGELLPPSSPDTTPPPARPPAPLPAGPG